VIDFRYHLVSIIAVFLALAIGIVVGANELKPTTESFLNKESTRVSQANKTLLQQQKILKSQISADQDFAQAASGQLISHLLTDQSVVLVTAPGASNSMVTALTSRVEGAGATVTGLVSMSSSFFNPSDSTEAKLTQLAQTLAPEAGVTLSGQSLSGSTSGQAAAAQVIAAALVTKEPPGPGSTESQQVLGGFGQSGYLEISNAANGDATTLAPATLAIVVPPSSPPSGSGASAANQSLVALAEQFSAASDGAVLAGTLAGSGAGSAISAVAGSGKVSTVDYADQPVGQIITVQALSELAAGRSPSSYGVGPGAVPSPAPTPSVSPTTTATRQVKKKK
jgi:Copper transport outer membrane protein, MctB